MTDTTAALAAGQSEGAQICDCCASFCLTKIQGRTCPWCETWADDPTHPHALAFFRCSHGIIGGVMGRCQDCEAGL